MIDDLFVGRPLAVALDLDGASKKIAFQSAQKLRPGRPCVGTSFKNRTHMLASRFRSALSAITFEAPAALGGILRFALRRTHLALRFAAATASRALE